VTDKLKHSLKYDITVSGYTRLKHNISLPMPGFNLVSI